jgi:hypothetical protein
MKRHYEITIRSPKGPVTFWAKSGGYLWVDQGNGGAQACEGGHVAAGRAISIGGEYTDLSDAAFAALCRKWWRQRRALRGKR